MRAGAQCPEDLDIPSPLSISSPQEQPVVGAAWVYDETCNFALGRKMNANMTWIDQRRMEIAAQALTKHGFTAVVVGTKEEAAEKILEIIPPEASVGAAGSQTLRGLGIMKALEARGNQCNYHWRGYEDRDEETRVRKKANSSDFLLSSTNAVTLEGEIVNVDGTGNRVAGLVFGPSHVIIVAEIEAEQSLVAANRELIARFEKNIQATLARVWGEDAEHG